MPALHFERKRIFIWGKTAPELSRTYYETVCTGGVTEDGSPIRLYPIPYRYMEDEDRFRKYQWITALVARNHSDPRPESYRIDCDSIEVGDAVPPDKYEWGTRRDILFRHASWQFNNLEGPGGLLEAQQQQDVSLGVVTPREILSVELYQRPDEEVISFEQKREELRRQNAADRAECLFDEFMPPEMKGLECNRSRVRVRWRCHAPDCSGHVMQVMDWEVSELQRKRGGAVALQAVQEHLNLSEYAVQFFLGNMHLHPTRFSIVGLWYPKRAKGLLFV